MNNNVIILVAVFSIILLALRGYMGLTIRLALSKKERKNYQSSYSLLSRWFFWSAYRVIKDKKDKYEKRIIRYKAIMKIYRLITTMLHCGLFFLCIAGLLVSLHKCLQAPFRFACWIYTITVVITIFVLAGIELYENFRYHKNRFR